MKKLLSLVLLTLCLGFVSCSKDEPEEELNKHTLIVYMPWANLYSAFVQNLTDLETAIQASDMSNQRVIVFLADGQKSASMFEITVKDGVCQREEKNTYDFDTTDYTTVDGLFTVLNDAVTYAPAQEYSMIIGCHGMGWLPVTRNAEVPLTRWFGGVSTSYRTEISTLRQALSLLNIKLQFLLFDDCYMANVETAYELKDVTNYLIGSTCEIMSYGMPYQKIGQCLLNNPDYERVCSEFLEFYQSYTMPYGTISVTSTSQLASLAQEMKTLNDRYTFDTNLIYSVQSLDGYDETIFFDLGDYIDKLVQDDNVTSAIHLQLEKAVPYRSHTDQYFSAIGSVSYDINSYCGLTVSDPSENYETSSKSTTSWWTATH